MKKNALMLTLVVLLFILGYLTEVNKNKLFSYHTSSESMIIDKEISSFNLPVSQDSKNVTGVSIHYFFTGTLKELKKISLGTQIIYNNPDKSLPDLIATAGTRVSRITPPYEINHVSISIDELKAGETIGISAEFNIASGTWSLLDVYLPTDRN